MEYYGQDSPYGSTTPVGMIEYSRQTDSFSQPGPAYHTNQISPILPPPQNPSSHLTPDFFMFQDESPSDTTIESPILSDSPEPLDYPIGTWNDGVYDLASPHAVTTDDGADWNRQVPFAMVKTELAPVEENDENDEEGSLNLVSAQRRTPNSDFRRKTSFARWKKSLPSGSDACMPAAEDLQRGGAHPMPPAEESPCRWPTRLLPAEEDVFDPVQAHCLSPIKLSEPSIEDPLDDIPVRQRFSRHMSVALNEMEGFWDIASDAITCSYALGAEGDSNFDWHRPSIQGEDRTPPLADNIQTDAADKASESPNRQPQPTSPSPSRHAVKRSSSVYSSTSPSILPVQTFPPQQDPPSASSIESGFSSIAEAVTPNETTESTMATRFSTVNRKEWCQPAYIVSNDFESQTAQDDPYPYHQMYTSDESQDAPFLLQNVGRIDGSTISNSPRSSRSPISKSSSQESFWYTQAASNARRLRNAGSVGSLPELMSSKNSRERFDPAVDQSTDSLSILTPSDFPADAQATSTTQRRRSPNLAKDAAQNIILSKVRCAEEPMPMPPASRERATSDVTLPAQDSSMPPPAQPAAGRRMRSGSCASSLSARGSRGSYSVFPPPHTPPARNS